MYICQVTEYHQRVLGKNGFVKHGPLSILSLGVFLSFFKITFWLIEFHDLSYIPRLPLFLKHKGILDSFLFNTTILSI